MESGTGSFWSYITLDAAKGNWQQVLNATKCSSEAENRRPSRRFFGIQPPQGPQLPAVEVSKIRKNLLQSIIICPYWYLMVISIIYLMIILRNFLQIRLIVPHRSYSNYHPNKFRTGCVHMNCMNLPLKHPTCFPCIFSSQLRFPIGFDPKSRKPQISPNGFLSQQNRPLKFSVFDGPTSIVVSNSRRRTRIPRIPMVPMVLWPAFCRPPVASWPTLWSWCRVAMAAPGHRSWMASFWYLAEAGGVRWVKLDTYIITHTHIYMYMCGRWFDCFSFLFLFEFLFAFI